MILIKWLVSLFQDDREEIGNLDQWVKNNFKNF